MNQGGGTMPGYCMQTLTVAHVTGSLPGCLDRLGPRYLENVGTMSDEPPCDSFGRRLGQFLISARSSRLPCWLDGSPDDPEASTLGGRRMAAAVPTPANTGAPGIRTTTTGDVLHHPIQCGHPDWTARGDLDRENGPRDSTPTPRGCGDDECPCARYPFRRHLCRARPLSGQWLSLRARNPHLTSATSTRALQQLHCASA